MRRAGMDEKHVGRRQIGIVKKGLARKPYPLLARRQQPPVMLELIAATPRRHLFDGLLDDVARRPFFFHPRGRYPFSPQSQESPGKNDALKAGRLS